MEQTPAQMSSTPMKIKPRLTTAPKKVVAQQQKPQAAESIFKNIAKSDEKNMNFTLSPTHVTYANSLRRAVLTLVESVAFNADIEEMTGRTTDVKITKNSTPMSNEMLAHRIGLLPIHVANPLTWNPEEYTFSINVKNESTEPMDITADNIDVFRKTSADEEPQRVPSRQFFHPNRVTGSTCLLAVLKGKIGAQQPEELVATMKATVGTGRQHARWMPVSQCSYRYTPDTDPEKRERIFREWLSSSKKVDASELDSNSQRKADLQREFQTMEAQRCFLETNGEPYSFDFMIETIGTMTPESIVARAIDNLQARCLRYVSLSASDLPENVQMNPADARFVGFDFVFKGEDETLGNLLQTYIEQNMMDGAGDVIFVGFKVPHPLVDEMVLRVGIDITAESKKGENEMKAAAAVANAAKGCVELFRSWRASLQPYLGSSEEVTPAPTKAAN